MVINKECKDIIELYLNTIIKVHEILNGKLTLDSIKKAREILDKEIYLLKMATGKMKQNKKWSEKVKK